MELYALKQFKCLKEQCVQHCCIEWMVKVDTNTLKEWNKESTVIRKSLYNFARNEQFPGGKCWFMRKNENGNCLSLDNNGLCLIQARYGESKQPEGCRLFPRQSYMFAAKEISTATLACPEIARSIGDYDLSSLINDDVRFDEKSLIKFPDKEQVFYRMYIIIRKILGSDNMALSYKLFTITKFTGELINDLEKVQYNNRCFEDIFNKNLSNIHEKQFILLAGNKNDSHIKPDMFFVYWKAVAEIILKRGVQFKNLNFETTDIFMLLAVDFEKAKNKKIIELKNMLCAVKVSNAETKKTERFLQNYVYLTYLNHGFPLKPRYDNLLLSLAYCNVTFAITSILMVAYQQQNKTLTKADIINIIWQVERILKDSEDIYVFIAANQNLFDPDHYAHYIRYFFGSFISGMDNN